MFSLMRKKVGSILQQVHFETTGPSTGAVQDKEKFPINYTVEKIRYRALTAIRHYCSLGLFKIHTNFLLLPGKVFSVFALDE